jgi:hypothetical protein
MGVIAKKLLLPTKGYGVRQVKGGTNYVKKRRSANDYGNYQRGSGGSRGISGGFGCKS